MSFLLAVLSFSCVSAEPSDTGECVEGQSSCDENAELQICRDGELQPSHDTGCHCMGPDSGYACD